MRKWAYLCVMKAKPILPFNWRTEFENMSLDYSIGSDLIILDRPVITSAIKYPFKVDVTAAILCLSGTMKGRINLQPYISTGCCLTTILPGQPPMLFYRASWPS